MTASCRTETGNREGIHPERDLGQKFYFKQKYGVSMYLNSYQNPYAIMPIIVYNKQSCLGCVFQKSQHTIQNQISKNQTKELNVDLMPEVLSFTPGIHCCTFQFAFKSWFQTLLIYFIQQSSYTTINKSCGSHGYS